MTNPLITLATIVGREEAVIERYIRSFFDVVDHMVFCEASGSIDRRDRSIEIASLVCKELGMPATFLQYHNRSEFPHIDNFSEARQLAWEAAEQTKADYLLWADCDDILEEGSAETISAVATEAKYDVGVIPYKVKGDVHVGQEVMRERLIRNDGRSRWRYPIHEQLAFSKPSSYVVIRGAQFTHKPHHEKTGSHQRNVSILSAAVEDTARNYYYLHQEYFDAGNFKASKECAAVALNAHPRLETLERYETLLNLAQTEDGQKAKLYAAEAFELMPDRREALALLTNYALIDGNHDKALALARLLMSIPKPTRSYWSLNHTWYTWKGAELYLQCLRLAGQETESFEQRYRNSEPPLFSIIHATLGRPRQALAVRELWLSRARWPEKVEYIFGLHDCDKASESVLKGFQHTMAPAGCGCPTNYDIAAGAARGKILIQAQDDCYPPPAWDEMLLKKIGDPSLPKFVAVADGHRTDRLCVNSIMTRAYADLKAEEQQDGGNGFFPRAYDAVFADTENTYRAYIDQINGKCELVEARDIIIYHDHPAYNQQVPWDATYQQENSPEAYAKNGEIFRKRNPSAEHDNILNLPPNPVKEEA